MPIRKTKMQKQKTSVFSTSRFCAEMENEKKIGSRLIP